MEVCGGITPKNAKGLRPLRGRDFHGALWLVHSRPGDAPLHAHPGVIEYLIGGAIVSWLSAQPWGVAGLRDVDDQGDDHRPPRSTAKNPAEAEEFIGSAEAENSGTIDTALSRPRSTRVPMPRPDPIPDRSHLHRGRLSSAGSGCGSGQRPSRPSCRCRTSWSDCPGCSSGTLRSKRRRIYRQN
ncbi:MAG: hypothetical protein MZV70_43725 [Desulfobacterales bacterium]|nr:hypothetical protein [Desulfobacterales bacterium]